MLKSNANLFLFKDIDCKLVCTVTLQVIFFPFAVSAVITAAPFAFPITFPELSTLATFGLLLVHVIDVCTFDVVGLYVTFKSVFCVPTKSNVTFVLFKDIDCGLVCTVTLHVATFPFVVVALIVVVPFATPVTFPELSTVAIPGASLFHVILLFVFELVGLKFTFSLLVFVPLISNVKLELFNDIDCGLVFTVTLHVAFFPFVVVTVIVVVPFDCAVMFPDVSTDTIPVLSLLHVNPLLVFVDDGLNVTVNFSVFVPFKSNVVFPLFNDIDCGLVFTVTLHVALFPFGVFTVITASPFEIPVIFPLLSTDTTPGLLLSHVNVLFAFVVDGLNVTVNLSVCVPLISKFTVVFDNFISFGLVCTVIVIFPFIPVSDVAVIIVVPFVNPVTVPFSSTVAIFEFDDFHIKSVASISFPCLVLATTCKLLLPVPKSIVVLSAVNVTEFITIFLSFTLTLHVTVFDFSTTFLLFFTSTFA